MTNQPVTPVTDDALPVTLVTSGAGRPEDDAVFMRELLDLRARHAKDGKLPSLAQMLVILGEPPSRKGFWSHRLADPPTRTTFPPEARDTIRRAVGEAPAPPVTEVTANMIDPSASMHWIGPDSGDKSQLVLMVALGLGPIEIYANGTVSAKRIQGDLRRFAGEDDKTYAHEIVTLGTGHSGNGEQNQNEASTQPRTPRPGVSVTRATEAQNERRKALGVSWADVIEAGLQALGLQ